MSKNKTINCGQLSLTVNFPITVARLEVPKLTKKNPTKEDFCKKGKIKALYFSATVKNTEAEICKNISACLHVHNLKLKCDAIFLSCIYNLERNDEFPKQITRKSSDKLTLGPKIQRTAAGEKPKKREHAESECASFVVVIESFQEGMELTEQQIIDKFYPATFELSIDSKKYQYEIELNDFKQAETNK